MNLAVKFVNQNRSMMFYVPAVYVERMTFDEFMERCFKGSEASVAIDFKSDSDESEAGYVGRVVFLDNIDRNTQNANERTAVFMWPSARAYILGDDGKTIDTI